MNTPSHPDNNDNNDFNDNQENIVNNTSNADNVYNADNENSRKNVNIDNEDYSDSSLPRENNPFAPDVRNHDKAPKTPSDASKSLDETNTHEPSKSASIEELARENSDSSGVNESGVDNEAVENTGLKKILVIVLVVLLVLLVGSAVYTFGFMDRGNSGDSVEDSKVTIEHVEHKPPVIVNSDIVELDNGSVGLSEVPAIGDKSKASFVFAGDEGVSEDTKIVDVYMTFSGIKSVDMLIENFETMEAAVADNKFALVVHPVGIDDDFSTLAPEAIAQAAVSSPAKAWDLMENVLVASRLYYKNGMPAEEAKESILLSAQDLGLRDITAESLDEARFRDWIFSNSDAVSEAAGEYIPAIYVNDVRLDHEKINFNDTNELLTEILK